MIHTVRNCFFQILEFMGSFRPSRDWFELNQPVLIRLTGALFILFLGAFIAPSFALGAFGRLPQLVILGVLGLFGAGVLIRYPSLSFIGFFPAALLAPISVGTGTGTSLNAGVLVVFALLGLWVLDMVAIQKKIKLVASLPVLPAVLLATSSVLAFGFGQLPWFLTQHASITAQIGGVMMFVITTGAFLVTAHRASPSNLRWMVWLFIGISGIYMLSRLSYVAFGHNLFTVPNGATGSLFWTWLLAMTTGQLLFNNKSHPAVKALLGILVAATVYIALVVARDWVSGWLPPLAAMAVILWFRTPYTRIPITLAGLGLLAMKWSSVSASVMGGDNTYSLFTRVEAWKILLKIIAVNPILGVGPANYYFYTYLFPIQGYYVQFNSHNNYIDLLAQTGIVGLSMFIWFLVQMFRLAGRLRAQVRPGFDLGYVYGVIGGLAGTAISGMLGDWVIPFVYNVGYDGLRAALIGWVLMGGLVAIEQAYVKKTNFEEDLSG